MIEITSDMNFEIGGSTEWGWAEETISTIWEKVSEKSGNANQVLQ